MGGYVPPDIGRRGGEMTAEDLLPRDCSIDPWYQDEENMQRTGIIASSPLDGRVDLRLTDDEESTNPKCLLCRSGVRGWLRVYTG